jgi:hypothetical protein
MIDRIGLIDSEPIHAQDRIGSVGSDINVQNMRIEDNVTNLSLHEVLQYAIIRYITTYGQNVTNIRILENLRKREIRYIP